MVLIRRRGPHVVTFLAAALCQLGGLARSAAQDSVPRDIRSGRATAHPIPMVEQRESGVTFSGNVTTEVFGNLAGGTSRAAIWESLFIAGMKVDFEKAARVPGLSLSVSGLYAEGAGLTNKAVHDLNTLSNIDAYDSVRLYEAWLQQEFWDGRFSIRLGQILADAEFFVSDYGALFINSSFGAIPLVSQNLEPPIFPVAAPGLRLRAAPSDAFYAEAAVFSGAVGDPGTNNKHGVRYALREDDGALVFFELGYQVNPPVADAAAGLEPAPLAGTYKLGGFYDSGQFKNGHGGRVREGDVGLYLVAEQEVWHPEGKTTRALAVFGRIGFAPRDRNTVPLYLDAGLNFRGILPSRTEDTLGLAFSYAELSDNLVKGGGDEEVVELTYRLTLGVHLFLQPDLQFIVHPGAVPSAATAVAAGLRLNIQY